MNTTQILWADDEIDLLKPHIMFLSDKGYEVTGTNSGSEALELVGVKNFDVVLLDENMPGLSGIETLNQLKQRKPDLPVIMITKSEEEFIMEDAIGGKISDYLIKPVNPNQILLSLKKTLDDKRLVSEKITSNYQQEFRNIGSLLSDNLPWKGNGENDPGWVDIYKRLVYWELELDKSRDESMAEILKMQKSEANELFSRFVERSYKEWLSKPTEETPVFSDTIFRKKVAPMLDGNDTTFLVLIDNLRWDQWKVISPVIKQYFTIEKEDTYCSILPTATQYSRNAFFAGMMPSEIEKRFPKLWLNDEDEGGKNMHEEEFLREQLNRLGKNIKSSYNKITNHSAGKKLVDNISNLSQNQLNVIVYNFVDMLSHARTEMEMIRELADDEKAYRSLTLSWFENSPLQEMVRLIAEKGCKMIITTDHGTIKVNEPSKIIGDKNVNTNLRYKQGKRLDYQSKDVLAVSNPAEIGMPKQHVSSTFVFAKEDKFFAYPNNYNHYVKYYRNTFQHGGISMEEMIIPFITLNPK